MRWGQLIGRPRLLQHSVYSCSGLAPQRRASSCSLEAITNVNVHRCREFRSDVEVQRFRTFLSEGRLGVMAIAESGVVGHGWCTSADERPLVVNGYFRLEQGESLIHNCNVSPEARGKRVFGDMICWLASHASPGPPGPVLIDTQTSNPASRKAIERAGCVPLGTGIYAQLGTRLVWSRFKPLNPG